MNHPIRRDRGTHRLKRMQFPAVLAISAVTMLAACSPAPAPAPTSSNSTASSSASASSSTAAPTSSGTPTAAGEVNGLVAGFPTKLIPLMAGATIQGSSIQRTEPLSIASLTASTAASPADVMAYYSKVFTDQGFTAQPLPTTPAGNVQLATFVRGAEAELVTVSITTSGPLTIVTIGANVLPASLQ